MASEPLAPEPPLRAVIVPVTAFQQNCTLIWCTKTMRGAFVDAGGDLDKLVATAAKAGVTIEKLLVIHVIHCPGHTPGHVVFYHQPSRLALVGDVLFKGSIGRTDFPRGNHQHLIDAITEKLWPLGGDTAFVCGHGPMSTFGHERASNPFVG